MNIKNILIIKNSEEGYSPAYIFLSMIVAVAVVMTFYTLFHDFVTTIFYNMGIANGGSESVFDLIVDYWTTYFIIGFVISALIWAVVHSMIEEGW